jgi:hypothetical protein
VPSYGNCVVMKRASDSQWLYELFCWGLAAFGIVSGMILLCTDLRAPHGRCVPTFCSELHGQCYQQHITCVRYQKLGVC